jgi:hypothetical protein
MGDRDNRDGGPPKKGNVGLKRLNILALRTAYMAAPDITVAELAREYGCSREHLSRLASKEGWAKARSQVFTERSRSVGDQITDAVTDAAAKAARTIAGNTETALVAHASVADRGVDLVGELLDKIGDELRDGKGSLRGLAETLKVAAESADKFARLGRDVRGIRPGEASEDLRADGDEGDDELGYIFEHYVVGGESTEPSASPPRSGVVPIAKDPAGSRTGPLSIAGEPRVRSPSSPSASRRMPLPRGRPRSSQQRRRRR